MIAENLDKLTGGKFADQISTVSAKVEAQLDNKDKPNA